MIRVLFLAQLREQLKTAEVTISSAHVDSIAALKQQLVNDHPEWEQYIGNTKLLVAVNHEYAKADSEIKAGDEVAFFPSVTGG
ncbi:MoaD/ThiS family protein [Cellvibrio sp. NN19]|uniref:MoaD/ThiS family protein n=1 Tax=Cellvibrio chitinivorans TaxID=3102792 RepID=UPI002B41078F|nr:MoaD/ThiS family protein [Cellvibrio sp. NN19]